MKINSCFPRYDEFSPEVPVWCVTPNEGGVFHRFFDTSPFNPSGTLMAVLRMPREDQPPKAGETAEVVLVDLAEGSERVVAETAGWECQMGANIAWASDTDIVYNDVDVDSWRPYAVRLNVLTGAQRILGGTIYHLSPDGTKALSSDMTAMRRTQRGYGVIVPDDHVPRNLGLRDDDGLFMTNTETGERTMIVSLKEVVDRTCSPSERADYDTQEVYGFHSKWNPQGDRLIFTIRRFAQDHPNRFGVLNDRACIFDVYTMREDGSELHNAVPSPYWRKGGHHINWFPDGKTLSMNLNIDGDGIRFVQVGHDGHGMRKMLDDVWGSGHPTVHPNGRHVLTDAYAHSRFAHDDGTAPIRLVDRKTGEDRTIIRIPLLTPYQKAHPELRVDPHPAWDRTHRTVAFNAFAGDTRRVYVADLSREV